MLVKWDIPDWQSPSIYYNQTTSQAICTLHLSTFPSSHSIALIPDDALPIHLLQTTSKMISTCLASLSPSSHLLPPISSLQNSLESLTSIHAPSSISALLSFYSEVSNLKKSVETCPAYIEYLISKEIAQIYSPSPEPQPHQNSESSQRVIPKISSRQSSLAERNRQKQHKLSCAPQPAAVAHN